jgi:predicted small integral membrane protein
MKNTSSNSISFLGLLTILFVGLKLTGYINWAWYWILGPLWIPLALGIIIAVVVMIIIILLRIIFRT